LTVIAKQFSVPYQPLHRHAMAHVSGSMSLTRENVRKVGAAGIERELRSIRLKAMAFYRKAKREDRDQSINNALTQLRGVAELRIRAAAVVREVQQAQQDVFDINALAERLASVPGAREALALLVKSEETADERRARTFGRSASTYESGLGEELENEEARLRSAVVNG
jgi:hypothetical protein